uniref:Uncharacterized protein n=1 Tax=Escherichia coli TaxID=562 RepID=A0A8F1LA54_ECOLX|nr:hypothetical protein IHCLGBEB_00004 [Escherichia coli]
MKGRQSRYVTGGEFRGDCQSPFRAVRLCLEPASLEITAGGLQIAQVSLHPFRAKMPAVSGYGAGAVYRTPAGRGHTSLRLGTLRGQGAKKVKMYSPGCPEVKENRHTAERPGCTFLLNVGISITML